MPQRLVFSQTFEGLQRALGDRLTGQVSTEFRALGVDFAKGLEPAYELDVWVRCVRHASQLLNPELPEAEQLYRFGRAFIDGYERTMVGKAMLTTLRLIGPKRTLARMDRNLRSGNNYTQTRLEPAAGPNAFTLWVTPVRYVDWYRGLLSAGVEAAGAKGLLLTADVREGEAVTYRIRWS
jgi:uncharacterized protein (TIGR02265 family)